MSTADLLSHLESCSRKGFWSRDWEPNRLTGVDMLQRALREAMLTDRKEFGEVAGETVMELAETRGLETRSHQVYDSAVHHAALSDILSVAIRAKDGPWSVPETLDGENYVWESGALLSPDRAFLRRFVLASSWSPERQMAEIRSWRSIGEVVQYRIPMQMIVAVLGPHRDGKRHSHFTKGLMHPKNGKLRFRKKSQSTSTEFKDTWSRIWREDYADITPYQWLSAMIEDDVLAESLFVVNVPVPEDADRVLELCEQKLERLRSSGETPEPNLSTCYFPVMCPYVDCCWGRFQVPSEKAGFVPADSLSQARP